MVLEHALIDVQAGREAEFEAAYAKARKVLSATPGCLSARLHRGVESPSRYLLLVVWESLDDHLIGFRESERFGKWRALIGPFFDGSPEVDHYRDVELGHR